MFECDFYLFLFIVGYNNLGLSVDFSFGSSSSDSASNEATPNAKKKNKGGGKGSQLKIPVPIDYKLPDKLINKIGDRKIKILTRINIRIEQQDINKNLHHLKNNIIINSFDLIAVEPSDGQVLNYLCLNNFNVDIISINSGIECGLTDKHLMRPLRNVINFN
jgi:hypothetical protein